MSRSIRADEIFDFIYTYGWAIIIVLVAIGTLWYIGIFDEFLKDIEFKSTIDIACCASFCEKLGDYNCAGYGYYNGQPIIKCMQNNKIRASVDVNRLVVEDVLLFYIEDKKDFCELNFPMDINKIEEEINNGMSLS